MNTGTTTHLKRDWFIIKSLISKDFTLKYRRSVLGVLWSVLNPLLMMLVLTAVFSTFIRFDTIPNYPLYLILGTTMFSLMADSTSQAMNSIRDSSSLIKKVRIDKIIFPLEKVLFQTVCFFISLIAVAIVMLYFRIVPSVWLVMMPLLLFYLLLFSAGLGMLLSSLAVFFQDVCHLWGVITTAWMYATPCFYPFEILPDWMQFAEGFNPMYHYITYFRDIVLYGTLPSLETNLMCLGFGAVTFAIGLLVFKKTEKKFILYV